MGTEEEGEEGRREKVRIAVVSWARVLRSKSKMRWRKSDWNPSIPNYPDENSSKDKEGRDETLLLFPSCIFESQILLHALPPTAKAKRSEWVDGLYVMDDPFRIAKFEVR